MKSSKRADFHTGVECCVPLAGNPSFLCNRFHLQVGYAAAQKVYHCPALTEQATIGFGNKKLVEAATKAKAVSVALTATDAASTASKYRRKEDMA